jgi:isopentenyldiphosphate isomerase
VAAEELVNVYDFEGRVLGARPRGEAKASGLAVGAVNALVVNPLGELLMQRRPRDKENGGRWDKSVGGHVGAGEEFDATLVREAGEELFDEAGTPRVRLADSQAAFEGAAGPELAQGVVFRRVALQLNLRDVRLAPGGEGVRSVVYHIAIYAGRTALARDAFRPQPSEVAELRYVPAPEVDRMLIAGELVPNMAFLWLTQARALLALAARGAGG